MKNLVSILSSREAELRKKLDLTVSPVEAVEAIDSEIRRIKNFDGGYLSQLTSAQARLVLEKLDILEKSFQYLASVRVTEAQAQSNSTSKDSSYSNKYMIRGAMIGAAAGLFSSGPFGFVIGGGAGALFNSLAVNFFPQYWTEPDNKNGRARRSESTNRINFKVNSNEIIEYLYQVFKDIDNAVAHTTKKDTQENAGAEIDEDILILFQDIMSDFLEVTSDSSIDSERQYKRIRTLLRRNKIDTLLYKEQRDNSEDISGYFDFEPGLDSNAVEDMTIKPAFVKNGELILRGLVFTQEG